MDRAVSEPHFEYCLCQSWHISSKRIILMQSICHLSGHVYSQLISAFYHLLLVGLGPKDRLAGKVWIVARSEKMIWAHNFFVFGFRFNKQRKDFLWYPKVLYMLKIWTSWNSEKAVKVGLGQEGKKIPWNIADSLYSGSLNAHKLLR